MNGKKVSGTFSGGGSPHRREALVGAAQKRFLAPFLCAVLLTAVIFGAAVLRVASLGNRPMHCDEAVHGVKLLESGGYVDSRRERDGYVYNPREFHGPSLNYLTLPIVWLGRAQEPAEITENSLRLLPAVFGVVLVGLVWLLREELGIAAALCAAVLTALSPAMVFYSRYFIQEMLLVCFTFGAMVALGRYVRRVRAGPTDVSQTGGRPWLRQGWHLLLLGMCIGMMHASKETCVIALFAMVPAAAVIFRDLRRGGTKQIALSALVVVLAAAGVSALFYSSFLHNPQGVVDSYTTYWHYLARASGEGTTGPHDQPWYHYFNRLFWWRSGSGPLWSEASVAVLALVGLVAGVCGRGLKPASLPIVRFLAIYTVLMTVVYSAIPYKTPWCALGPLHGMILLAGVGMVVSVRAVPGYCLKAAMIALLAAATVHLAWQAYRVSFVAYEDVNNPYVYAHTSSDVPLLAEQIGQIAAGHPDGRDMRVQLICPDHDYWPLPWYLREFRRLDPCDNVPPRPPAPVIITQPSMRAAVRDYVYEKHTRGQPLLRGIFQKQNGGHWQLRPNVPLLVVVRHDLLEAYRNARARSHQAATGGRAEGP